jgi:hypothetical protein
VIREGSQVAFVGHPRGDLRIGDEGVAIDVGVSGTHVRWLTGARQDQVDLIRNGDLVPNATTRHDPIVAAHSMRQDEGDGWFTPAPGEITDDEIGWGG